MQKMLLKMLCGLCVVLGVSALANHASAQAEPEVCTEVKPAEPGEEALAGLVGSWSLVRHDGQQPGQAVVVRFMNQGKAEIRMGQGEPFAATYGINCCGYLVLSQSKVQDEAQNEPGNKPARFETLIAEFELADDTLTLFARDGDWVFARIDATSRRK